MAEEKNFENRVKQWLRSKGCYVVKYYGCGGTRAVSYTHLDVYKRQRVYFR